MLHVFGNRRGFDFSKEPEAGHTGKNLLNTPGENTPSTLIPTASDVQSIDCQGRRLNQHHLELS